MKFLQLFPSSRFEYYGSEGCIFDLLSESRFTLDEESGEKFSNLIKGKEYIREEYSHAFNEMISAMMRDGMLYCYDKPMYHEPMKIHNYYEIKGMFDIPPMLANIYIEASDVCGKNCKFCGMDHVLEGCKSCVKWKHGEKMANRDQLLASVERLICIPTQRVTILGGDPLLNWEYVSSVIRLIRQKSNELSICLYVTNLDFTEEIFDFLKQNHLDLRIIFVNADDATSMKMKIQELRVAKINVEITLLGAHSDVKRMSFMLGFDGNNFDEVESVDYAERPQSVMNYEERQKQKVDEAFISRKGNRCLDKRIAISLSGDVKVCPAWDESILNVTERNVAEAFYDYAIGQYWEKDRERIKDCNQLKWLCKDCMIALKKADEQGLGGHYFCGRESKDHVSVK